MADNKWINANGGAWETGANWSLGHAPTSSEKAVVDAASFAANGKVITIGALAQCAGLDVSASDQTFTISSSVYSLELYGNYVGSTNCTFAMTGTAYVYSKATMSVTTNGQTLAWNRWYIDGAGITVTNADDCNIGASDLLLLNATWTTNNKTITTLADLSSIASSVRTINLGSSLIYCRKWIMSYYKTNLTFNAGTSTITATAIDFNSNGNTFYNVIILYTGGTGLMYGSNIFNNLTVIGGAIITSGFKFDGNQTVNGVLTLTGANATTQRMLIQSDPLGTPRTITCNGTTNITNCDFRDIVLAGSANRDFSAQTDIGNCGGNSGITFPPALNLYIVHTSGAMSVSNAAKWKLADLVSAGRVPLPQDSALGVAGSFSGASTVTMDCPRIGSLDLSAVNQAVGWANANGIEVYGHFILGNNITVNGAFAITLKALVASNVNTYGKTLPSILVFGGIYTLLSNLTVVSYVGHSYGCMVNFNGFDVNTSAILYSGGVGTGRTITLGSGTLTITAGSGVACQWPDVIVSTGSTVKFAPVAGASNISVDLYGYVWNKIWLSGGHTGNFDIASANTIAELIIDNNRKVRFTAGTTQAIAKLTLGTGITWSSITSAQHTISYTGPVANFDYLTLSYSVVSQANKLFAGLNSTDSGNNSGWVFGQAQLMPVAFTEPAETLASSLIVKASMPVAFTEPAENMSTTMMVKASMPVAFTEPAETLASAPIVKASMPVAFTEPAEEMASDLLCASVIAVAFTEPSEKLVLRTYEKIIGASNITDTISGISNFK